MDEDPPEGTEREELRRVRAQLTTLVERRLDYGLTPEEEADYRRLTELERDLIRKVGPGAEDDDHDGAAP